MKSFEEKVVESIMGKINISREDAVDLAKGLIEGKIPYINVPGGKIEVY